MNLFWKSWLFRLVSTDEESRTSMLVHTWNASGAWDVAMKECRRKTVEEKEGKKWAIDSMHRV